MFWHQAVDQRMLRTLDWLNDECETELRKLGDLELGAPDYVAIMSPVRVEIGSRRFHVRNGKWPISMLVTNRFVAIGTKKKVGRRARVTVRSRIGVDAQPPPSAQLLVGFVSRDEIDFVGQEITEMQAQARDRPARYSTPG